MPELVNSRVGSLAGTSELDGTMVWPLERKYSRKVERISEVFMHVMLAGDRRPHRARATRSIPPSFVDDGFQGLSSSASSTSAWVTLRTVAAAKPRRKRNCARR